MGYMDKTLKQTVPYYSTMKRAGAFRQPQKPQKRQKRTTLTEYSQNGQKAVLKPHVTVNQAAKKLYDYEQTGLSPHEVANLVEQVQNLTRYDIVTGETEEMAQELRDVAAVLKITEATDTNIRTSMESILRIADRLERKNKGEKRR